MRTLDTATATGLTADVVRTIYFVRLHFDAGIIGWNTGYRDVPMTVNVNGVDQTVNYLGLGQLTSIDALKEESGISAAGLNVGVSGIDPAVVSLLLSQPYVNRAVYIHFALLDENDVMLSAAPVLLFRGSIDSISGTFGNSASFTVAVKSRLADWERPRKSRYTDAEQQKLYPGDKGFEFVAELSQRKLIWPRAAFLPDARD